MDLRVSPPRREPVHPDIDEPMIEMLVRTFYERIQEHPTLGPVFAHAIEGDWEPHLLKMCDFWSSVMLMTGRYKGKPMVAHARQKTIKPEHFAEWLTLFEETANDVCPDHIAPLFMDRAERIARSLHMGLFYRPEENDPDRRPSQ